MRSTRTLAVVLAVALVLTAFASQGSAERRGLFGLGGKTFGGSYTWSDEIIYNGWRVQKSAMVGHYRLLDPKDRRETFGSLDHCITELERLKREKAIAPLPAEVVIVAHGLGGDRKWMNSLCHYLNTEGGMHAINFGYPSTMGGVAEQAESLASVINHLEGVERVNFVAHSMGNIVIRHYLKDLERLPEDQRPPVTFGRFVMISPPNHGAKIADNFTDFAPAKMLAGKPVEQLAPEAGWQELEQQLTVPSFEFGIIVGGRGDGGGYLHAVPGDDDGLLSVETSKLDGAVDYVQIPKGIHQMMPKYKQVQEYTLRFLEKGYFLTANARQPIGEPVAYSGK